VVAHLLREAPEADVVPIALPAALASRGARPLNHNRFKVPLMENLVRRALRA